VNALVQELNGVLAVLAPVADIEHPIAGAEQEVSRVGHFFSRRHRGSDGSPAEPVVEPAESAGSPAEPVPPGDTV
jgi:hypothetical protein